MSFDEYSSNDLLASITSAFDLGSSPSDEKPVAQNNSRSSGHLKAEVSKEAMDQHNCSMESLTGAKEDLPSFGQVYSTSNPSYLCFPPETLHNNNLYRQPSQEGKYHQMGLASETCYSGQEIHIPMNPTDCFPTSNSVTLNNFWPNDIVYNPLPNAARNSFSSSRRRTSSSSTSTRSSTKRSDSKQLEDLKLRYNRTLSFLKESDLYDVTMKAADLFRRNALLEIEIDQLRSEMSNYFSAGGYT